MRWSRLAGASFALAALFGAGSVGAQVGARDVRFAGIKRGALTTEVHARVSGHPAVVTQGSRGNGTTILPVTPGSVASVTGRLWAAYSSPSYIVVDARNSTGPGTSTATNLTLTNHDTANQEFFLCYAPINASSPAYRCDDLGLAPNTSLTISDVVSSTFPGFGQPGSRGQITVTPSQNPGTLGITATTVTTITDASHSFNGGSFLYQNPVVKNTPLERSDLLDNNGPGILPNTLTTAADASNNDQALLLYATSTPVTLRVTLHDPTYTVRGTVTTNLNNYQTTITPLTTMFNASTEPNDVIDVQVTSGKGAGAVLLTTDKKNPTTRAIAHTKLATQTANDFLQYLPGTTTGTAVQWHNLNPGANNMTYTLLKNDTDNTNPFFVVDATLVFNLTKSYPDLLTSPMNQPTGTKATIKVTSFNEPFSVTSTTNHPLTANNTNYGNSGYTITGITQDKAAVGLSGDPFDAGETLTDQEIDQLYENNQYTSTIGLVNDTEFQGTVSATLTCLDDSGAPIGTPYTATLPTKGSTELPGLLTTMAGASASTVHRLLIHVNQAPSGDGMTPRVLAYAKLMDTVTGTSVIVTGHQISYYNKVTGDEYVNTYLTPIAQARVYLNNTEARCMLRGDCAVPGITNDLANILSRGIGETWAPPTFASWLTQMADGITSSSNIELWTHNDPFGWSYDGNAVGFSITKSQSTFTNEPGTVRLSPSDTALVFNEIREFLISYVSAHPEQYGGSATTGPNLEVDPTWRSTDPN